MSYDLTIWSVRQPDLVDLLSDAEGWSHGPDGPMRSSNRWQVVVSGPHRALPEDVPDAVGSLLPGVAYLTELSTRTVKTCRPGVRRSLRS